MDTEHIKFLKGVCGKLIFTTMTLLTFVSLFVTCGNSYGKQTVSLLCYSRPLQNIKFLQQIAIKEYLQFWRSVHSITLKNYTSPCAYDYKYLRNRSTAPCLLHCSTKRELMKKHWYQLNKKLDKTQCQSGQSNQEKNLIPMPQIKLQFLAYPTHTPVTILTNTTYIFSETFTMKQFHKPLLCTSCWDSTQIVIE
jgi:hypothetical protein